MHTIVIALIANIVIAVAKLIGGLVSGSSGLLAEAAHSAADLMNEIFLAVGLHRDRQPADAAHPDGHGRERFLWAFMAAIAAFLISGCRSIATAVAALSERGVRRLLLGGLMQNGTAANYEPAHYASATEPPELGACHSGGTLFLPASNAVLITERSLQRVASIGLVPPVSTVCRRK